MLAFLARPPGCLHIKPVPEPLLGEAQQLDFPTVLNRSLADFQGNLALGTPEQNDWIFRRAEKIQVQSYAKNLGSHLGTEHCKSQLSNTLMPHPHCSAFPQLGPVDLKDLLLSGAQESFTSHPPRPRLQLYLGCDTGMAKVAVSTILS